jgi:hypothetical protein
MLSRGKCVGELALVIVVGGKVDACVDLGALVPCLGHLMSIFGHSLCPLLDMAKNRHKVVQKQT